MASSVVFGGGFVGGLADLQIYKQDMTRGSLSLFTYAASLAMPADPLRPVQQLEELDVHEGLEPNGSYAFRYAFGTGSTSAYFYDIQFYNTTLDAATIAAIKANGPPLPTCNLSSIPPPPPEPPLPPPPPPRKVALPSPPPPILEFPSGEQFNTRLPMLPPPAPRVVAPTAFPVTTKFSVTGCIADGSLIQPCSNYTLVRGVVSGSECPFAHLRGSVSVRPVGSLIYRLYSDRLYESGFIGNPNDLSTLHDFRFYGYVTTLRTGEVVAVIGVTPCTPIDFKLDGQFTAKWVSTQYDVQPVFSRFVNFTAVDVFGRLSSQTTSLRFRLIE
jgi:hypothetical protein